MVDEEQNQLGQTEEIEDEYEDEELEDEEDGDEDDFEEDEDFDDEYSGGYTAYISDGRVCLVPGISYFDRVNAHLQQYYIDFHSPEAMEERMLQQILLSARKSEQESTGEQSSPENAFDTNNYQPEYFD